jgi:hypothetical protein
MEEAIKLAFKREQAKRLAIKRAADICLNSSPEQWDGLAEAETAMMAPDVRDTFAKQIMDSISLYREVREREFDRQRRNRT